MPPRTRTKKDTTVTATVTPSAEPLAETSTPETTTKRTYDRSPFKLTSDFGVAAGDDVPSFVRNKGRTNPFDKPIAETWKQEYHARDAYATVEVDNVKRAVRQARSAATHLGLGLTIVALTDQETQDYDYEGAGKLWFRAKPKRGAGESEDGSDDTENGESSGE